jgi:hypothetical protein
MTSGIIVTFILSFSTILLALFLFVDTKSHIKKFNLIKDMEYVKCLVTIYDYDEICIILTNEEDDFYIDITMKEIEKLKEYGQAEIFASKTGMFIEACLQTYREIEEDLEFEAIIYNSIVQS